MRTSRFEWVPYGLVVLGLVPVAAGLVRLSLLASGGPVTPGNSRFFAVPFPVVAHIVAASLYTLVGAFQFSTRLRLSWPLWHRWSGWVLTPCGLVAALTGLWMAQFYPLPASLQGPLLLGARYVVGVGMVVFLGLGLAAILRRRVAQHRAWMMRAYALGIGAGTQVLTALPWTLAAGEPVGLIRDVLLVLAWVINAAVAELILRRRT